MKNKSSDNKFSEIIPKFIDSMLPDGIINIDYKLERIDDNEYYMDVTFIVPDDSELLSTSNRRESDFIRLKMKEELKKNILSFFGKRMIINQVGIISQSFYERFNPNK